MKYLPVATLALVCLATPLLGQSAQRTVSLRSLMTVVEFQEAGLQKLSASELAALNAWFLRTAEKLMASEASASRPTQATRPLQLSELEGAIIVADDGEFLGKITSNSLDSRSIGNEIGRFGSSISSTSIFNDIGRYGGEIARMSPFNSITSTPPRIFFGSRFVAFLTVNEIKIPRIDPHALIGWVRSKQ